MWNDTEILFQMELGVSAKTLGQKYALCIQRTARGQCAHSGVWTDDKRQK